MDKIYKKISIFYVTILGIYQISDKLYGATFVAFMGIQGLSITEIGFIGGLSSLILAIADYPSGNISDKFGRKKIGSIGFIIWGIGLIVFGLSKNFISFLIADCIFSIGLALISGSHQSWYIDELIKLDKYKDKDKILPALRGIIMTFSIFGALLSTFLSVYSVNIPVIVGGMLAIIVGLISFIFFEDNYGNIKNENLIKSLIKNGRLFLKDSFMKGILVKNIFFSFGFITFILYWQIYVTDVLNLNYSFLGIILILMMTILTFSNFTIKFLNRYICMQHISSLGLILIIFGFITLSINTSNISFFIGIIMLEIGIGIEGAATNTWINDYIESNTRASFLSALSAVHGISGFLICPLVGFFIDYFSPRIVWLFGAISISISLILLHSILKFKKTKIS